MFSILIAEDEYLVRRGIRSLINFDTYQITSIEEAENGLIAWQKVQEMKPDIILTDINMPQLDGIKLAQLTKERYPETHIVFLTGYDDFNYAVSALKLGADDYLLKPFSKKDVEQMLSKLVANLSSDRKRKQVEDLVEVSHSSQIEEAIQEALTDSDLSLKTLAQTLGFSPNHLSFLIKKELGISFQDYLVQERLKKAKLLLLTSDLKIYEIAEAVGFSDMNYFSWRFKQVVGVSPRQFRKGEDGHV
ncbi:response regulator [Streptococcus didelphis]|uniref:Response regulator n=1 Tax=Streptococcus didelphis TaxID=102886 RepID=A0ABY9LHW9_9STRE|nr:response regulator [Streptococcus didelphis]WMB28414.1 response regulator [Streptococcus didelphis]WMB29091.1 response regulator [Streptococcus didelphis]